MPLIRVPRNATSCPCASCQESKTFSCYKPGGGGVSGHIRQRNPGVGASPLVLLPSSLVWAHSLSLVRSSFQHGSVGFQGRYQGHAWSSVLPPSLRLSEHSRPPSSFYFPGTFHLSLIFSLLKVKLSHQKEHERTVLMPYQMKSYHAVTADMQGQQAAHGAGNSCTSQGCWHRLPCCPV